MRTLLLLITFFLFAFYQAVGCSISIEQQYFCPQGQYTTYSIIRGEITKEFNQGLKMKVFEVYRGPSTPSEITIWDSEDFDCNGILFKGDAENIGKVGQTVLIYLEEITEIKSSWEQMGDYRNVYVYIDGIPSHHINLVQKGNKIKGPFAEGNWSVPVDEIAETLQDCIGESIHETPIVINGDVDLKLYPNPARGYLFIGGSAENANVKLYNMRGQLVGQKTIFTVEEGIDISNLTEGVYICVAEINGVISRKKFIVQK